MKYSYIILFFRISCFWGLFGVISCVALQQNQSPSPELGFEKVVQIQLTALANDNEEGIALAYKFAAPSNKRLVGPLERFIALFENPLYAPMLAPLETEFLSNVQRDNMAYQGVRILSKNGINFYYIFILERQKTGEFKDCWMTAAVRTFIDSEKLQQDLGVDLLAPAKKI